MPRERREKSLKSTKINWNVNKIQQRRPKYFGLSQGGGLTSPSTWSRLANSVLPENEAPRASCSSAEKRLLVVSKVCQQTTKGLMTSESEAKRVCLMKTIGTHNGTFHCDEALACYLLKMLPEFKDAEVVRTRDQAELDKCDVVVDVGGVFDPSKNRFDHHQRSFTDTMNTLDESYPWATKLSSAGLVYFHFGHKIISQVLQTGEEESITKTIFRKVYENFVEEIDAIDNGISQYEGKPRYHVSTTLSSRVGHLNPSWNEKSTNLEDRFQAAMKLAGEEFVDRVKYFRNAWWPARELVEKALNKRKEVDESGEIMVLDQGGCPWKDHLLTLEEELKVEPGVKFVLYEDQNKSWRVQAVPLMLGSFDSRLALLEEWRGLRDEELSKKCGISGCVFVHASGFIGGNKTYEGALEMARRTLQGKPTLDS